MDTTQQLNEITAAIESLVDTTDNTTTAAMEQLEEIIDNAATEIVDALDRLTDAVKLITTPTGDDTAGRAPQLVRGRWVP